jgi:hypothetical protein
MPEIEIYVRHSGGRSLLHVHLPAGERESFLSGLAAGEYSSEGTHLELSVLPEWITDDDERARLVASGSLPHLRIPLSAISVLSAE